jgi:hypothetical protein
MLMVKIIEDGMKVRRSMSQVTIREEVQTRLQKIGD